VGAAVVLRLDLRDFFLAVPYGRIHALFLKLGYRAPVARLLARLTTHGSPPAALAAHPQPACLSGQDCGQFRTPHLPQGAPSSPALANLAAFRLDVRLAALAEAAGVRYTRYADDLVFSGGDGFARSIDRFTIRAMAIALEEGFTVNARKTRSMRRAARQVVGGIVVNHHPNMPRRDFDTLKAVLTNCVRHGPQGQNREGVPDFRAVLAGKVAYAAMVNPARGAKLRRIFEQIEWLCASRTPSRA
jgi:hypothetical protein